MTLLSNFGRVACVFAVLTLALAAIAPSAGAQGGPPWDHYKVYRVIPNPTDGRSITLTDQFTSFTHTVSILEWFANPTQKQTSDGTVSPIFDPRLHYAWWRISDQPFGATVSATNQFGDQVLELARAVYLWNPALKNEQGPLPPNNHYKCYDCSGLAVNRTVTLVDQFGTWQTVATTPRFFCTPTEKEHTDGIRFPIVDPDQHYICYDLEPPDTREFSALILDQFLGPDPVGVQLSPGQFLCVPTMKVDPTPTLPETWGRLKTIYR